MADEYYFDDWGTGDSWTGATGGVNPSFYNFLDGSNALPSYWDRSPMDYYQAVSSIQGLNPDALASLHKQGYGIGDTSSFGIMPTYGIGQYTYGEDGQQVFSPMAGMSYNPNAQGDRQWSQNPNVARAPSLMDKIGKGLGLTIGGLTAYDTYDRLFGRQAKNAKEMQAMNKELMQANLANANVNKQIQQLALDAARRSSGTAAAIDDARGNTSGAPGTWKYVQSPNGLPRRVFVPTQPITEKKAGGLACMCERGMAAGGKPSRPVSGPGTGQSDEIPALLSDGEYVIDASTVADLGDGSTNAGAKALDRMVKKVRQQKRGGLGQLPPRAKAPEQYMKKGK